MFNRRRFKQTASLQNRLASFAKAARHKASYLPPGPERDEFLTRASRANTAAHIDAWIDSPGLQPPE